MRFPRIAAAVLIATGIGAGTGPRTTEAGPPCIGGPIDTGCAKSLPCGAALHRMRGERTAPRRACWPPYAHGALDPAAERSPLAKNVLRPFGRDGDTLAALRARLAAPAGGSPDR